MTANKTPSLILTINNFLLSAAVLLWCIGGTARAADNDLVPADLQAKLILTALTYNRNLQEKPEHQLKIGVLSFPASPQSQKEAEEFHAVLNGFKNKKISGLNFDTAKLTYSDIAALKKDIADNNLDLLYLARGEPDIIREVIELTRAAKVLSCTGRAEYVSLPGVSMAVGLKDNKPKIYLNYSSAQLEGVEFSAKFLRIAEIIGKE